VKTYFSDLDKVSADTTNNFVVVVGQPGRIREVKEFIQKIDVPPAPPVVPKTEIVPIKYGVLQTILSLSKSLFPGLSFGVEDRLNALVVVGTDSEIERFKTFLATIDTPLPQVMMDIRVVSLSEDASKTLGFTIGSSSGNFGVFASTGGTPLTFTENTVGGSGSTGSLAIAPFTRTPFVIGATLSMLISRNDAKVISTPRIMTTSNQSAQVLIGDKFPIVYFDPRAGQFQVQYVDIGVKLVIKPIVSADGFVQMEMAPEVSTLEGLINNQYPRTSIVTVKSLVRVRDGDTVIVGGLLKETETYSLQKLPFLADLPIIGNFFKNTAVDRSKQEVFITVTPKIMP